MLVVDDSDAIRVVLCELLAAAGLVVVGEGSNGQEAVCQAELLQPDLVVLDDRMPIMRGIEAVSEIRRRCPGVKILLYSATSESIDTDDPPDVLVRKGEDPGELLAAIAEITK